MSQTEEDLGGCRMSYEEYAKKEQLKLIMGCYHTFKGERDLDFLSDNLLFEICKAWIEQGSDFNFGDFVEYYLECGEDDEPN